MSGILVAVLAFPPNIYADAISWNGGPGQYSDPSSWTCAPECTSPTFPSNVAGQTFEAVINSGTGDSVLLNTPSIITSLGLGGSGVSAQSTLNATQGAANSLTLGSHDSYIGSALNVGNGGVLNINGGSTVTLQLSQWNDLEIAAVGEINIGSGGSLAVQNDGLSTPTSYLLNNGSINVDSGGSLTLSGAGSSFSLYTQTGESGRANLSGGQINGLSGGEYLVNDSGHTIAGSGSILNLAGFSNGGTLQASGGTLQIDAPLNNLYGDQSLHSGNYIADDSSTLQLSSIGAGNSIASVGDATNVTLRGSGLMTGDGVTNALAGLQELYGGLNLQQGASLTSTAETFTAAGNGRVSLSGSSLDLAANGTTFGSEVEGALVSGYFQIGDGSTLTYQGNDISAINQGAGLSLEGTGKLVNTAGANPDPLSNTLSRVDGSLSLSGAASSLTLAGAERTFTVGDTGMVDVWNGATLSLSGVGFTNEQEGVLTGGSFTVGDNARLEYAGNDITTIGSSAYLSLYGSGQVINTALGSDHNAVSNTLTTVNGGLNLVDGATIAALNPFTNNGYVGIFNGSTLIAANGFTNSSTESSGGLCGCEGVLPGDAKVQLFNGSSAFITGALNNISSSTQSFDYPYGVRSSIAVTDSYLGAGSLVNQATLTSSDGRESSYYSPESAIELIHGTLEVDGNVTNAALSSGHDSYSSAYISLQGGSTMTVGGSFTNNGGARNEASLTLESSTATVNGAFSNTGNAIVGLGWGSTLNTYSGFANTNSSVGIVFGSTLNASVPGVTSQSQSENGPPPPQVYGFANTSNDASFHNHSALLQLGLSQEVPSFQGFDSDGPPGDGSVANITGGLLNSAVTSNGRWADSTVHVDYGSTLNADFVVNEAKTLSESAGHHERAEALIGVSGYNSVMSVTGDLNNTAGNAEGNTGFALAKVNITDGASLSVGGNVLNTFTNPGGSGWGVAVISLDGGTLDVTGTFTNTAGFLNLKNESTGTVYGQFTNDVNSRVNLDKPYGGSSQFCECEQGGGSILNTNGFVNNGTVNLSNYSTLSNTGDFTNSGSVNILNGSQLTNLQPGGDGPVPTFTNTGTITTGGYGLNTINVTGNVFNTSPGAVNLTGYSDQMTVTGQFSNSGTVSITGSWATLSADSISNLSGGHINVSGDAVVVTSTGAITNSGTIAMTGLSDTVESMDDFDNTVKGIVTVGSTNTLKVAGKLTNHGLISVTDAFISADTLDQAGTLNIEEFGQTTVTGTFKQTAGKTNVAAGGVLIAQEVLIAGGVLSGDGTIYGNVKVDGGTLAPGDPQSIDIIGNYEQTLAGILDLAFLADDDYDQINVMENRDNPLETGNVLLGGTLNLTLMEGFGLGITLDTVFHILTWTGTRLLGSDFDVFHNQTFSNGTQLLTFQKVFGDHGLDLNVVLVDVSGVPEPSTVSMFFAVMLLGGGVAWARRRKTGAVR